MENNELKNIKANKNFVEIINQYKIFIAVFVVIIIVVILCILNLSKSNSKTKTNQKEIENTIKDMGIDFYENYYYNLTGTNDQEKAEYLSKYKDNGIRINIDNLGRYNIDVNKEKIATLVNSETTETCDLQETKIIIYPKEPYGLKDYETKIILICGFDTLEELQLKAQRRNIENYEKMTEKELKEAIELYDLKQEAREKSIENYDNMTLKELRKVLNK